MPFTYSYPEEKLKLLADSPPSLHGPDTAVVVAIWQAGGGSDALFGPLALPCNSPVLQDVNG